MLKKLKNSFSKPKRKEHTNTEKSDFFEIPRDILFHIFSLLSYQTVVTLLHVSKQMRNLAIDDRVRRCLIFFFFFLVSFFVVKKWRKNKTKRFGKSF
jgi:hypothetical protein